PETRSVLTDWRVGVLPKFRSPQCASGFFKVPISTDWRVGVSQSSDLHSERRGFSKFRRQKQVPGISEFPSSNASVG
ncbi:hypothetical protein KI387_005817, partial [Taxus chinensis]